MTQDYKDLIDAAQPAQAEPVAFVEDLLCRMSEAPTTLVSPGWKSQIQQAIAELRTAQPQPLTLSDEQIEKVCEAFDVDVEAWKPFARAVLAAAQEKQS